MLDVDPSRRSSCQDLLRHAFITGVPARATPVSPLRSQLERMSLGEGRSAAGPSSIAAIFTDKENGARHGYGSKIAPIPLSHALSAATDAPASARVFGAPASSRLSYDMLRHHTRETDALPSSNITPRYGAPPRW
jgi:hypothetical protein